MFGDNKTVVTSSTIPHSTLGMRWNALSYHRVCEAIAGGWLRFEHIPGKENPADILTKTLPWSTMCNFVEPLPLWKGDTKKAPSGSSNPEGSIANPGREPTRDPPSVTGFPPTRVVGDERVRQAEYSDAQASPSVIPLLWNNQYGVLADVDED